MKTTKRQFKLFCDEFRRQAKRMGIVEWELRFFQQDIDRSLASCQAQYKDRIAAVRFTQEWNDPLVLDDKQIMRIAKHEALHLLVWDVTTLGHSRFIQEDEIMAAEHTLIGRLEKLL